MNNIWDKLRKTFVTLIPALAVGSLLGIYPGYKAYRFMWKDAQFCITCHQHDYASQAWKESIHGMLTTCHDCHHQSLRQYTEQVIVLATQKPKYPQGMKHIPYVTSDLCESCHVSNPKSTSNITGPLEGEKLETIPKIEKTRLHDLHLNKQTQLALPKAFRLLQDDQKHFGSFGGMPQKVSNHEKRPIVCMDCHGSIPNRAHNFSATDAACINCHEKISHTPSSIQKQYGCRNCHFTEFLIEPVNLNESFR